MWALLAVVGVWLYLAVRSEAQEAAENGSGEAPGDNMSDDPPTGRSTASLIFGVPEEPEVLSIKQGVKLAGLQPEMVLAAQIAESIYLMHGAPKLVITSALEGRHKEGSLHYSGYALDLRIWDIPHGHVPMIVTELKAALGADYDVVLEADHIHVEFDPK